MCFSIILLLNLVFVSISCAENLYDHGLGAVAKESPKLNLDILTTSSYKPTYDDNDADADLYDLIDAQGSTPRIYENALSVRSEQIGNLFKLLKKGFSRRRPQAKEALETTLKEHERHLVLEFAGKKHQQNQKKAYNKEQNAEWAAKKSIIQYDVAQRNFVKYNGAAALLAARYGAINPVATQASIREQVVANEMRLAKKELKGHRQQLKEANKDVRNRGKDIENIGLVNKEMQARMKQSFPPLSNPERPNRDQKQDRQRIVDRLKGVGHAVKDWIW